MLEMDEMLTMAPPASLPHGGNRVLHAEEHALGVDVQERVPRRRAQGVRIVRSADPRIVHEDVEPSEGAGSSAHRLLPVELTRHVELDELRLASVGVDLGRHLPSVGFHDVGHHHDRALAREENGFALAHAVGPSRDHRYLPAQSHGSPPR
jgi:hypothetical protein